MYAEDPFRKFLPSTGPLVTYREPAVSTTAGVSINSTIGSGSGCRHGVRGGGFLEERGLRVDAGVVEGSAVSIHYDPMISKVIAFGDTREEALDTLGGALDGE